MIGDGEFRRCSVGWNATWISPFERDLDFQVRLHTWICRGMVGRSQMQSRFEGVFMYGKKAKKQG
jgi:hypothetical protein